MRDVAAVIPVLDPWADIIGGAVIVVAGSCCSTDTGDMVVAGSKRMLPYHGALVNEWSGDIYGGFIIVIWELYVVYLPFNGVSSGGSGWHDASVSKMTMATVAYGVMLITEKTDKL